MSCSCSETKADGAWGPGGRPQIKAVMTAKETIDSGGEKEKKGEGPLKSGEERPPGTAETSGGHSLQRSCREG